MSEAPEPPKFKKGDLVKVEQYPHRYGILRDASKTQWTIDPCPWGNWAVYPTASTKPTMISVEKLEELNIKKPTYNIHGQQ